MDNSHEVLVPIISDAYGLYEINRLIEAIEHK